MKHLATVFFLLPLLVLGCSKAPEIKSSPISGTYVGVRDQDDVFELVEGQFKQGSGPDMLIGTYKNITQPIANIYEVMVTISAPEKFVGPMTLTIEVQDGKLSVFTQETMTRSFYEKL